MSALSIVQFKKTLENLDSCMAKAEAYATAKKFDVNVLANYRLAPDMFHLVKQVQSCCDTAKFAASYLSKQTPPKHEDNEVTFAELRARIQKVIAYRIHGQVLIELFLPDHLQYDQSLHSQALLQTELFEREPQGLYPVQPELF
mgnify:CR=1 FL=1